MPLSLYARFSAACNRMPLVSLRRCAMDLTQPDLAAALLARIEADLAATTQPLRYEWSAADVHAWDTSQPQKLENVLHYVIGSLLDRNLIDSGTFTAHPITDDYILELER